LRSVGLLDVLHGYACAVLGRDAVSRRRLRSLAEKPGEKCGLTILSSPADISHGIITTKDAAMIQLTKINGAPIVVNPDLIEYIEETPDTVITLTTNVKVVVKDPMVEIIDKVVQYRRVISGLVERECERRLKKV
jgi:flagellar protein FlbD